ncbi:MAG: hypothetical protein F4X20_02540 [Dehalococcoidia bacterium]|nr:hypothetical protein [Dehalococcoidia bacterium]
MIAGEKRYRLLCAVYAPSESTDPDKYMAEIPAFPNCVAWGDTAEEAVEILESVVTATIQTYRERGYALPESVSALETQEDQDSEPRVLEISA